MWESFNSHEQDLVRSSIDHKFEQDLNLDKITNTEREEVLSNVFKSELKDIYSPDMEKNGAILSPEQQNKKRAVINAIVDIANNPQKIKPFSQRSWYQLLPYTETRKANITDIFGEQSTFTITAQEIADEIYWEWEIDMIEEVELALDQQGWIKNGQISPEWERLKWRMSDGKLIEFKITNNHINWEYKLSIKNNDRNPSTNPNIQILIAKIDKVAITGTREECIREIQRILRNKNKPFTVTWIEDNNTLSWDDDGIYSNSGNLDIGNVTENNNSIGNKIEFDYDYFINNKIPKMNTEQLLSLLWKVTWENKDKIEYVERNRIINAILDNNNSDPILKNMSINDIAQLRVGNNEKVTKEIESRLLKIENAALFDMYKEYMWEFHEIQVLISNEILSRFDTFNNDELLQLYKSDGKWYSAIRNRFQKLGEEKVNEIIQIIKWEEYEEYAADVSKSDVEKWASQVVTVEEQRNNAVKNFKNYIYKEEKINENID